MYAYAHPTISPNVTTDEHFRLTMVVLEEIGTNFGAVWGVIALVVLFPITEQLGHNLPFPESFSTE